MSLSVPRILVLEDFEVGGVLVKLGDVLEEIPYLESEYWVINRKSDGTRPRLPDRVVKDNHFTVTISPKLFVENTDKLKKVSLTDTQVSDITGIRGASHDKDFVEILQKTYVKEAPCEKSNNSSCAVSGGRKRTARRKHPRRKNRRRLTSRK